MLKIASHRYTTKITKRAINKEICQKEEHCNEEPTTIPVASTNECDIGYFFFWFRVVVTHFEMTSHIYLSSKNISK